MGTWHQTRMLQFQCWKWYIDVISILIMQCPPFRTEQDGVHKWLVFVSAFVTIVLTVGFCFAIGSLFLAIMDEFESTRAEAAVIQSTVFAVFASTGIVAGAFVKKFGPRKSGLVGSLCISLGITVSYFAASITYLIFSIGIVSGAGNSFFVISSSTAVEKLFEGKRKLVILSILFSGSGVGGMIYPYFLVYLNAMYGLNGTLLLVGVICAHSIPCSLLWINHGATLSTSKVDNNGHGNASSQVEDIAPERNHFCRVDVAIERGTHDNKAFDNNSLAESRRYDNGNEPHDVIPELGTTTVRINGRMSNGKSDGVRNQPLTFVENTCNAEDKTKSLTARESIIYLLKNKAFVSFMIALAISYPIFLVPLIFIVDIFVDKGYTETEANLGLLLFNVFGVLGRLYPAYVVQFPTFPTIFPPIISSFVSCLSIIGISLLPNVKAVLVICAVTGLCQGIINAALLVLPAKLFGRDNLPTALGLLFTSIGIGNATVGPVSGMIRDSSSSYNVPLYSAAGCQIVAGGMFIVAHVLRRKARTTTEGRGSVLYVTKF